MLYPVQCCDQLNYEEHTPQSGVNADRADYRLMLEPLKRSGDADRADNREHQADKSGHFNGHDGDEIGCKCDTQEHSRGPAKE